MIPYGTVSGLRLRINKTSTADDAVLLSLLQAASEAIDRFTNHIIPGVNVFAPDVTATARYYPGSGTRYQRINECVAITEVAVMDSTSTYVVWGATDWRAFTGSNRQPNFNDLPYSRLMVTADSTYSSFLACYSGTYSEPSVRVTARWGVTLSTPPEISTACYMLAARWWKRMESAMADTLASGELGQLIYTQEIDPDVKLLLRQTRWYAPQGTRYT